MQMFEYMPKWERAAKKEEAKKQAETIAAEDGSVCKVPYTSIVKIERHPSADRLELAFVYGFQVIVQKGKYQVGDRVIYVPTDSVLPSWLEQELFPEGSKIKLTKSRVRQIRIRKVASQGMIIDPQDVVSKVNPEYLTLEQNLAAVLDVTKYEPPFNGSTGTKLQMPRNKPLENARFHKYGGVDNWKFYPNYFDGNEVILQEKFHGSNCRAGYVRTQPNTLWKKILKFFGKLPSHEYTWGSNNVQLQHRPGNTGYYGRDVYKDVLDKVDAFNKLKPGETIFGELIGPGVQRGYEYGHKEHHFVLFDVKVEREDGSQEYLDPEQAEAYAKERGFDFVPVLYRGIFNAELAKQLSTGPSVYYPPEKVREGIVIKARTEYSNASSKRALKLINEEYLDNADNTDNH
jgi:RNA ligase (TIGR02306 family)